jgi:hypothetical protein
MNRNFLVYWSPGTVDREKARRFPMGWAASNQFRRLDPNGGDALWIAAVRNGNLYLVACNPVEKVVSWDEAVELLDTDDIWEADYVAITKRGDARPIREVDITDLAAELRFISPSGKDRLRLKDGRVDPQQLQTMRELEPDSAGVLSRIYSRRRIRRALKKLIGLKG